MFYNNAKKEAIEKLKSAEKQYNSIAKNGNDLALDLYSVRKSAALAIERIEQYVNSLANSPKEFQRDIAETMATIKEFREAVKIEKENSSNNIKGGSAAAGGTVLGGIIVGVGPTAAMAIATTFGTASTGTAISLLTGAAAQNAALAWLGGGALAAGGGGMAAGNALLALAGPIGWGIAGISIIGGGAFASVKNKKAAEQADNLAKETLYKIRILKPKLAKLRYLKEETENLKKGLNIAEFNLFPKDYSLFNDEQKKKLAAVINNAKSMGKLINERIE